MKNNTLFAFNAEANKKRVNNNTLFIYDAEANYEGSVEHLRFFHDNLLVFTESFGHFVPQYIQFLVDFHDPYIKLLSVKSTIQ